MPEKPVIEKDKSDNRLFQYTFNGVTKGGYLSRAGASNAANKLVKRAKWYEKRTSSDSVALP